MSEESTDWIDEALKRGMGFKNDQERAKYVESIGDPLMHPMFATKTEDLVGNPLADAIRILKEEGKTNIELATLYKEEGNTLLQKRDYAGALDKYDYALAFLTSDEQAAEIMSDGGTTTTSSTNNTSVLMSQILSNISLVHLFNNNFKLAYESAVKAIGHSSHNLKAHYRKCKALLKLKKYSECLSNIDAISITFDDVSSSKDFSGLIHDCEQALAGQLEIENKKRAQYKELQASWTNVWNVIQTLNHKIRNEQDKLNKGKKNYIGNRSNITIGHNLNPKPEQLKNIFPSYNNNDSLYTWPVLFLYPQYNQIDTVTNAISSYMVVDYLADMFPEYEDHNYSIYKNNAIVPWDKYHEYHVSSLVVYIILNSSPVIPDLPAFISHCQEERALQGFAGEEECVVAQEKMNQRLRSHNSRITGNSGSSNRSLDDSAGREVEPTTAINNLTNKAAPYLEIHFGCTIEQLLTVRNHVLSGAVLTLVVYVRDNAAHKLFLSQLVAEGYHAIGLFTPDYSITYSPLTPTDGAMQDLASADDSSIC